jgi:hypothetical protein
MSRTRRTAILARLAAPVAKGDEPARLCSVCADVTGVTGAGIMLMRDELSQVSVCTSDDVSFLIERLQFELGEGPCVDAHREERPVHEPNLAASDPSRWVAFSPPALDAGVQAIFAFPLRIGGVGLGALDLYRNRTGPLDDDQHSNALVAAEIAAASILSMQAGVPGDELADELSRDDFRHVVHQAAGMVSVQLDISVAQALVRLRARAFSDGRPVIDVASEVVDRTLRFRDDDGPSPVIG